MARLRGPSVRQFYYTEGARKGQMMPGGVRVSLYDDEACTVPADVLALDGSLLPTSGGMPYVEIASDLQVDEFLFPDVQDPSVYYRIGATGPVGTLYPNGDARTDRLFEFLGEVQTNLAGITATAVAASTAAATPAAVSAALDATVVAMQASRRAGMADRALMGAGGWWVGRRNADEVRLMRDLGDGFVADHQLLRNAFPHTPGPAGAGPSGEPRPMLLNDVGVGIPMVPVPFSDATFNGAGWVTFSTFFGLQLPPPTLGLDANTVTVTTAVGSTTVTITSGALQAPFLRYNTRRIVIPGAGPAGADLTTTIGFVNTGGASMVVNNAASTAVSGVSATIYPGRRYNATPGVEATWTAPLGATSVGVLPGMAGNGGLHAVAIDGDLTRATYLPTAQQLVTQGVAPAGILTTNGGTIAPTTRILDCYNQAEIFSRWQALASGLDPTVQHTVTITISGYQRAASNNTRLVIAGWGYGTATTTVTTPGAVPYIALRSGLTSPVHELAIDHLPAGTTTKSFVAGNNHGYEWQSQALTLTVDGVPVTLTDGQVVPVAGSATLVRRSVLTHPQNLTTPTLATRTSYRLDRGGLTVNTLLEALVATTVDSVYFGSFTAPHTLSRVQVDKAATVYDLLNPSYTEGTYIGTGKSTAAAWWEPGGQAVAVLLVPTVEAQTGGWSEGVILTSIRNFPSTLQSSKWYARRTGSLPAGGRWAGEVTYIIGRLPDGASGYFPVQ